MGSDFWHKTITEAGEIRFALTYFVTALFFRALLIMTSGVFLIRRDAEHLIRGTFRGFNLADCDQNSPG